MAAETSVLSETAVRDWFERQVPLDDFRGKRVLVLVPDTTRTAPLPLLLDALWDRLSAVVSGLDVLVALGTHPPLSEAQIGRLLGIEGERRAKFSRVQVFNHDWNNDAALVTLGTLSSAETREMSQGLLSLEVPVRINARVRDYDVLLVLGPVFPHEVVGFSGGNKYFFPGIVRARAAQLFPLARGAHYQREDHRRGRDARAAGGRSGGDADSGRTPLRGICRGAGRESARLVLWNARGCVERGGRVVVAGAYPPSAAAVSASAFLRPAMYDELWVAGKCMYKLEPVVADGGELIIYAPHLKEISVTHGKRIEAIGYHVRDYFTKQWDRFKDVPWGVLAHSTHVRGTGTYADGVERPRVQVTLATGLSRAVCERINLGYRDPASIDVESFAEPRG